jgi:hypothetical protein
MKAYRTTATYSNKLNIFLDGTNVDLFHLSSGNIGTSHRRKLSGRGEILRSYVVCVFFKTLVTSFA